MVFYTHFLPYYGHNCYSSTVIGQSCQLNSLVHPDPENNCEIQYIYVLLYDVTRVYDIVYHLIWQKIFGSSRKNVYNGKNTLLYSLHGCVQAAHTDTYIHYSLYKHPQNMSTYTEKIFHIIYIIRSYISTYLYGT